MQLLAGKTRDSVIKDVLNGVTPEPDAPRLSLLGCGIYAHEVGTMRMNGPNNKPGVVDENLKVNGFSNLYACDLLVFPCSTPANPTRTLAALSLRLAEHLGGPHKQNEPALYQTMVDGIPGAKYEALDYDSEDD
ncbi:hypothetical protein CPB86DRAFT_829931 [Serendipita vermifera]|nr:hypothetical protein CPB86DRAFT_829931 [Serendipita vermifera]